MASQFISARLAKLKTFIAATSALTVIAAFSASAQSTTGILLETWTGITGNLVSNLTSVAAYPNSPNTRTWPTLFEITSNQGDNFGTRARAYVTAPTTGNYTFWIAGDDYCELWLSTDANPANIRRIAQVPGWATARQWTKFPEQTSAAIALTGGQRYYIETLHKEGTGGDNLAVGWQGPGITGEAERPIPAPAITSQPVNTTVNQGQAAFFSVTATGTTPTYQWRRNGVNIGGASSASYTTPGASAGDNGAQYSVVVSNTAGTVTSVNAILTVIMPPTITSQPSNVSVNVGQTATFTVAASGTGLNYVWRRNGVTIGGATAPSYTTPAVVVGDNGAQFSVVVSNTAGNVTSINAVLTVIQTAPVIVTGPQNATVNLGQTASFSVTATGTAPLSYQWQRNGVAISGATAAAYTTLPTVATDDGAVFVVVVNNSVGTVTSASATLRVISPPIITLPPAAQTINVGQTATFSVTATGTATLAYQWSKNGTNITGATANFYTTPAAVLADNGALFRVTVTNAAASVVSAPALLTVIYITPNNKKIAVSGELVDAAGLPLGYPNPVNVNAIVRLMNDSVAGAALYTEEFQASAGKAVRVANGLFVARLGEGTATGNLQQVVTANANLWVEITIDDGTLDVLRPRTPLTAGAYALGGIPAATTVQGIQGSGNPNTLGVQAEVGSTYVNSLDNTTWFRLNSSWKLMD
jgi:hypothetical protein